MLLLKWLRMPSNPVETMPLPTPGPDTHLPGRGLLAGVERQYLLTKMFQLVGDADGY